MRSSKIRFIYRSLFVLLIAALMVALALALTALATLGNPGDENGYIIPINGPSSTIRATGFDSAGNLYMGGSFSNLGYIASFDGTSWSMVGDGVSGAVRALTFDSSDNLYVGGDFLTAGASATPVTRTAMWDGATWSPLGSGVNGTVRTMVVSGTTVYVGGAFTDAGGVANTGGIAMWDGMSWSALGSGVEDDVWALAFDSAGNLYAAGEFLDASGVVSTTGIAMWDGASWSAVGGGMSSGTVRALAFDSAGNLYAAGSFSSAGGVTNTNRIAMWDGMSWSTIGGGLPSGGTVRALVVDSADYVYVCGDVSDVSNIGKWNGLAWSALGSGIGSSNGCETMGYQDGFVYTGGGSLTGSGGAWGKVPAASGHRVGRWTAAEGRAIVGTGDYVFYPPTTPVTNSLPVTITVVTQGDLARIIMQRYDKSHDNATAFLQTGYYWEILGLNASGGAASGFTVTLTLPAPGFTSNSFDRVCEYTGGGGWDCAADSYDGSSITREGVTSFSNWAVADTMVYVNYLPIVTRDY